MKVTLLNINGLDLVDSGIGECYAKGPYFPNENKALERINKVCNVRKHSSMLEFLTFTWEIEASTKVLLEMSRHRHQSLACRSSRYTLNKTDIVFEPTGDVGIDKILNNLKIDILQQIDLGKKNDVVALMLPQTYSYKFQTMFNARSLQNFLQLRLARGAHFQIREVSKAMFDSLPKNIQELIYKEK